MLSWLYSAKVIIYLQIHLVPNVTIFRIDGEPWSKPGEEDNQEEGADSSEEYGGFEKRPQTAHGKNGKFQLALKDDGNNNDDGDGESIFVILSDKHCYHERNCFVLKLS